MRNRTKWNSGVVYGWLRVHGPLLEISASSFAHQGKLRIPASQWQVNKSSDMYQDPSRCCQGSRRTLLREMAWGNWIGHAGKSTHFKSLSLPTYLCSRAHSWAYGPSIWCYHTLELNASWVESHSLHRKTWWGTPLHPQNKQNNSVITLFLLDVISVAYI